MAEQRETTHIVRPFTNYLKLRGWTVENIHGNQFQAGLPDAYAMHPDYSPRWIEYKVRSKSDTVKLTDQQKIKFPMMHTLGVPIYIIAAFDLRGAKHKRLRERLYKKLFEEPNVLLAFSKFGMKSLY